MKRWQERRLKKRAQSAFLEELATFADLNYLTDGAHGWDYRIEVPRNVDIIGFEDRLTELQVDIYERFGARIWCWVVAGAHPDDPGRHTETQTRSVVSLGS